MGKPTPDIHLHFMRRIAAAIVLDIEDEKFEIVKVALEEHELKWLAEQAVLLGEIGAEERVMWLSRRYAGTATAAACSGGNWAQKALRMEDIFEEFAKELLSGKPA